MSDNFDVDYKQLIIEKDFTQSDVALGEVNYELADFKNDLYKKIKDHIIPQKADEIFIHIIGETLLFMYFLSSCLDDNQDEVLKALMNKDLFTRHIGKVELKKMFRETNSNYVFYQAILAKKMFDCEAMRMTEKQITSAVNGYVQKEIIDTFLNKKQMVKLSKNPDKSTCST